MIEKLKQLAEQEHQDSYGRYPEFNSAHEAFSVLKEESQEALDDIYIVIQMIEASLDSKFYGLDFWTMVKKSHEKKLTNDMEYAIDMVYRHAINGSKELLQVAAMCLKTKASLGGSE